MQFVIGFIAVTELIVAGWVVLAHFDALVEQMLRRSKFKAMDWLISIIAFCVVVVTLIVALQPGIRGGWGVLAGIFGGLTALTFLRKKKRFPPLKLVKNRP